MDFWEWCRGLLFGSPEEQRAAEEEERAERARLEAERNRKEAELQRERENAEFAASIQNISRCAEVVKDHTDLYVRIETASFAISLLKSMLEDFPHRSDWREWQQAFKDARTELKTISLETELGKMQKHAQTVKTKTAKISAANKALLVLQRAEEDLETAYPQEIIDRWRKVFFMFIHHTELETLLMKADKAEFKEEWKKALNAYLDVLYFLKRDDIPDEEQAEQIAYIEGKISEMQEHVDTSSSRPRRVKSPDVWQ